MSNIGIMFFIAVLPIVLILVFVYSKDKNKEPIGILLQLFGLGILSCLLVLGVSEILEKFLPFMKYGSNNTSFTYTFLYAFIGVALVEELCKWIMLYIRGYNSKEFDELFDVVVYAVFVSLGFAFLENIIYVVSGDNGGISTAILRAISAVPGHACDAIFMGYYMSLAKQFQVKKRKDLEKNNLFLSILVPTLLHGIYDFCLMSGIIILVIIFIAFVIFLYIVSLKRLSDMSKNSQKFQEDVTFCTYCGAKIDKDFCPTCGRRKT